MDPAMRCRRPLPKADRSPYSSDSPDVPTSDRNQFEELLLGLRETGVDFIVCGGLAAVLHGVERPTLDLDIAISLSPENVGRLLQATEALGLRPRVPVDPAILADPMAVQQIVEEKHAVVFTFIHPNDPLLSLDIFCARSCPMPR
jgi:hypothetical protein